MSSQNELTSKTSKAADRKPRVYQDPTSDIVALRTNRRCYLDIREDLSTQVWTAVPTPAKIVTPFICSYL
jgi:hypothetical protein